MTNSQKHSNECGPFIACGAASVSFDHQPGEPTSVENFVAAIKRLFSGKQAKSRSQAAPVEQRPATAH